MAKKPECLKTILGAVRRYASQRGVPISVCPMKIYLWLDTNQSDCSPICGEMEVNFRGTVDEHKVFALLQLIDELTPIYKISILGKTFCVSKTTKFMEKRCDAC